MPYQCCTDHGPRPMRTHCTDCMLGAPPTRLAALPDDEARALAMVRFYLCPRDEYEALCTLDDEETLRRLHVPAYFDLSPGRPMHWDGERPLMMKVGARWDVMPPGVYMPEMPKREQPAPSPLAIRDVRSWAKHLEPLKPDPRFSMLDCEIVDADERD